MEQSIQNPKDKRIPLYFVMFFVVIALLDGIFVYMAVSTQTGLVIPQPYQKGLAFNQTLDKARTQPQLDQKASYDSGVLRWVLPMDNASVTATIIRPAHDGYDFKITLAHKGAGVYEASPDMPLKGAWAAKLKATWDNTQFQTRHDFIVK
ncbi:MAG: FixH family protein [Alphaproteobacteria bacterium]